MRWMSPNLERTSSFLFGLIAFILLGGHLVVALVRRKLGPEKFRLIHKIMAGVLLLVASVHWWPFVFFLIPATAVHATSLALGKLAVPSLDASSSAVALAVALIADVMAVCFIWTLRQSYMRLQNANLYVPFIFPPLATLSGFAAAHIVARGVTKKLRI